MLFLIEITIKASNVENKRIVKLFTLIKLSFKSMFDIRIIMTNNVKEKKNLNILNFI